MLSLGSTEQQGGNAFPDTPQSAWSREPRKSGDKADAGVWGCQKPLTAAENGSLGMKELGCVSSPLASFILQSGYCGPVDWS